MRYILVSDSVALSIFIQNFKFTWWAPKHMHNGIKCVMAVHGQARSLILIPIKARMRLSLFIWPVATLALSCTVSDIRRLSKSENRRFSHTPPINLSVTLGGKKAPSPWLSGAPAENGFGAFSAWKKTHLVATNLAYFYIFCDCLLFHSWQTWDI